MTTPEELTPEEKIRRGIELMIDVLDSVSELLSNSDISMAAKISVLEVLAASAELQASAMRKVLSDQEKN